MLGNWLQKFNAQEVFTILTGAAALYWEIWRCRNNIIFDNVIFSGGPILAAILVNYEGQQFFGDGSFRTIYEP